MQNNSNDKSWRQRLDEFEDISGNNLELNSAWEKLQQKKNIGHSSSSKKWFWLAAACITGLAISLVLFLNNGNNENIEPEFVKINQPTIESSKSMVMENSPEPVVVKQDQYITTPVQKSAPVSIAKSNLVVEPLLVVEKSTAALELVTSIDTITKQALPAIAVTKKLKLVHINELDQSKQGIAKEEGKPYFPITYQSKQVYTNTSPNIKKDKDNIIRIKLN